MGRALAYGLEMIGSGTPIQKEDSDIVLKVKELEQLALNQEATLTKREKDHVEALRLWTNGYSFLVNSKNM